MLGRLLFVRLKAAENALRDGRLDEAYRLVTAADLRAHRRGTAVLASLTAKFIERARSHYRAERCREALLDLDKAAEGGVMRDEAAELRRQVEAVAAELQRQERSRVERLRSAKDRVADGSLAAGRRLLERASVSDRDAQELRRHLDNRAEDAAAVLSTAEKLLAEGQLAEAAERIRRARAIDARNEGIARIEASLCAAVTDRVHAAMLGGRLGRAAHEMDIVRDLGDSHPSKRELSEALSVAREAARCVGENQFGDARRWLMALERMLPKAAWVGGAIRLLSHIEENRVALIAGPLADLSGFPDAAGKAPGGPRSPDDTVALPGRRGGRGTLPDRLLLIVDGGGSFLLLRGDRVSVGRAVSREPADIPIFSDLAERHANLARVDEDYLLLSTTEVEVAGERTKHQLLQDGQRIVFGRKAKLTFRLPSRKSLTAVVDLSDTTKMPNDVRRIVLFHGNATIGKGKNVHIPCNHAQSQLVLFERGDSLWVRPLTDGRTEAKAVPLRISEAVEIGGAGIVLETWNVAGPGIMKV